MDIQKNQISRKIDITDKKAEYDENVKYLLSEKIILAHILVYAVKEYFGMKPEDVAELIEGMPQVSKVAVNPGESNMPEIIGDNVEDTTPNEADIDGISRMVQIAYSYFKEGDENRNPLSEFNSNNTELLNVEQVKEKLLQLDYIKNELTL